MRPFATLCLALLAAAPALAQPANDNLAAATVVTALPYTASGTNDDATLEESEQPSSCGSDGGSLWWAFTPSEDATYRVTTEGSDFDTVLSIWEGGDHPLAELDCNDDDTDSGTVQSSLVGTLTAGITYYLRLSGLNGDTGAFVLNAEKVAPPQNDDLAAATVIESLPYAITGSNVNATNEAGEAAATCGADGGSIWWAFTPDADGTFVVTTVGSGFDTVLSIWTGSGHPLGELDCNDDSGKDVQSTLVAALTGGTTYYVRLNGYSGADGTYALNVEEVLPPTNDALADATVVAPAALPYTVTGTSAGASLEPGEASPSCFADGGSLWWAFTPTADGRYRFLMENSEFFSVLSLWTGSGHPLTEVACNTTTFPTAVVADLTGGTTYYLRLHGDGGETGVFDLRIESYAPPAGDSRDTPAVVGGALPQTFTLTTDTATEEPGEPSPSCGQGLTTRSVWYRYTPTSNGTLEVNAQPEVPFVQMSMAIYQGATELTASCSGFGERPSRGADPTGRDAKRNAGGASAQVVMMPITSVPVTGGTTYDIRIATRDGGTIDVTFDGPSSLPVELVGFAATASDRTARLAWTTASETNNTGFAVEQARGETWAERGFVAGRGTTSEATDYRFDVDGLTAGTHRFRLRQIDTDGAATLSPVVTVEIAPEGDGRVTVLGQRAVRIETTADEDVTVEVVDVLGRRIARTRLAVSGTAEVALPTGLAAGVYVVRVHGERLRASTTVVVR